MTGEAEDPPPRTHAGATTSRAERDRLITEHLGLAEYLARRFADRGESSDDLRQAASLALVKAADRFDPTLGFEFSTFATRTIVGELKHHFRDHGWAVRAPRHVQEHYLEATAATNELTQSLGRSPTLREVAVACGRTEEEILIAMEAGQGYRASSLDAPGGTTERALERFGSDEDAAHLEQRDELEVHLRALSERDRELVRLRFVDELSQSEIAERMGISQMHVSRLLRRAIEALRASYGVAEPDP
jgi:RNA polymerase sigma-B factor